jgi:hypothetical protein
MGNRVVSIILIYGLNMGYKDIIWYDDLEVLRYIQDGKW